VTVKNSSVSSGWCPSPRTRSLATPIPLDSSHRIGAGLRCPGGGYAQRFPGLAIPGPSRGYAPMREAHTAGSWRGFLAPCGYSQPPGALRIAPSTQGRRTVTSMSPPSGHDALPLTVSFGRLSSHRVREAVAECCEIACYRKWILTPSLLPASTRLSPIDRKTSPPDKLIGP
jgi:hypothetical protein